MAFSYHPVMSLSPSSLSLHLENDLSCVWWDVKPCSIQLENVDLNTIFTGLTCIGCYEIVACLFLLLLLILLHPFHGIFSWTINLGKPAPERNFTEARDDGVALTSAGPYANHLHLASGR